MKLSVALQLYSIRRELDNDFEGTLEKVRGMGFDGVEFAGLHGKKPEDIKAICEKLGLTPISAHVPYPVMKSDPHMSDYKAIGCKYIAVPYLEKEYLPGNDKYGEFVALAKEVGENAKANGMTLLYHNHDFEFEKLDGRYLLDIIYSDIPCMETEIDTCWVNVGGEDPSAYVRSYKGRAPIVHLKDFAGAKSDKMYALIGLNDGNENSALGGFEYRALGKGLQDIPAILSAAADAGADWVVVEQDETTPGRDIMDCVKDSIDYLKKIQGE